MAGRRLEAGAEGGALVDGGRLEAGSGAESSPRAYRPDGEELLLRPWEAGRRFAELEIASGPPLRAWRHPEFEEALRGAA
jgi:hypothetical protein